MLQGFFDSRRFQDFGPLVARVLYSPLWVIFGFHKITGFSGLVETIGAKGLPLPMVLAAITVLAEFVGGLMILTGFYARHAAMFIFLFIIPVTVVFHPVWADPNQASSFWKNVALMGAALFIVVHGSGRFSLKRD